ncbi:unnamed protein product [Ixodes hexagonus]
MCICPTTWCVVQEHLVVSKGYPFERHCVTTDDGYVLEMHRIPAGRGPCLEPCHREPVLLMTGLATDSASFVSDFPEQSLGFVLADRGYDVWMANTRGNTYGRQHVNLSVKTKRFWDFSFHEHGIYDAPAQIDYILDERRRDCLLYVGISQGTLMFFVMMSERPEYNAKVRVPETSCAGTGTIQVPTRARVPLVGTVQTLRAIVTKSQGKQMASYSALNTYAAKGVCALPAQSVCSAVIDKVVNFGTKYANRSAKKKKKRNLKEQVVTALKNVFHWSHLRAKISSLNSQYKENERNRYLHAQPPLYSLDSMTTDVGVFWSLGDKLVFPDTVAQLIRDLGPRVKKNFYVDDPDYTHINFVIALNSPHVLFPDILEFLARYLEPCDRGPGSGGQE